MRMLAIALSMVACGDSSTGISDAADAADAVDAPHGVRYELLTTRHEPRLDPSPTTHIDGLAIDHIVAFYRTQEQFAAASHVVELRSGDIVLAQLVVDASNETCAQIPDPVSVQTALCVLDHGELRPGSSTTRGPTSVCIADGFCRPRCVPGDATCPADHHCTARVIASDPLYTATDCVPVGTRELGQPCTDDCARGLVCLAGTCRALCTGADCGACPTPPRYPPEIAVCP